MFFYSTSKN